MRSKKNISVPVFKYNWVEILNYCETNFFDSLEKQCEYLKRVEHELSQELKNINKKIEIADETKKYHLELHRDYVFRCGLEIKYNWKKKQSELEKLIFGKEQDIQKDRQSEAKKKKIDLPIRKQHKFWGGEEIFQLLLKQLSLPDNGFIDEDSANNWKAIYDNHFTGEIQDAGKENKINWIDSISSFKYFYNTFFKEFFEGTLGYTGFFEAHFKHKIKEKAASDVRVRNECPPNKKKKLDRIFEHTKSLKINKKSE